MNKDKYKLLYPASVAGALALALATPAHAQEQAAQAEDTETSPSAQPTAGPTPEASGDAADEDIEEMRSYGQRWLTAA